MCNLYSHTRSQEAIRAITKAMRDATGNLPSMPGIFPDFKAPIVRNAPDGVRELCLARWGMPTPQNILMQAVRKKTERLDAKGQSYDFKEMLRAERDSGVTNQKHRQQTLEALARYQPSQRHSVHIIQRVQ
jgi:putative SOS response-associated peptidase YedK